MLHKMCRPSTNLAENSEKVEVRTTEIIGGPVSVGLG
jgi:hypothetical protein